MCERYTPQLSSHWATACNPCFGWARSALLQRACLELHRGLRRGPASRSLEVGIRGSFSIVRACQCSSRQVNLLRGWTQHASAAAIAADLPKRTLPSEGGRCVSGTIASTTVQRDAFGMRAGYAYSGERSPKSLTEATSAMPCLASACHRYCHPHQAMPAPAHCPRAQKPRRVTVASPRLPSHPPRNTHTHT